jgi:DNA-binding MarR family transcriptional regulator
MTSAGYELPFLLFSGFRSIMDEVHDELTRSGFPEVRPAHGFAMQAIGREGVTATELGKRLGVSKQAAGKTAERLEELGLATRATDSADHRRKLIRLTPLGVKALTLSVTALDEIRARWAQALGPDHVDSLESTLRTMTPGDTFRLDVPGWFGTGDGS